MDARPGRPHPLNTAIRTVEAPDDFECPETRVRCERDVIDKGTTETSDTSVIVVVMISTFFREGVIKWDSSDGMLKR